MTLDSQEKLRIFSLYNDHDLPRFWLDEHISMVSFQRITKCRGSFSRGVNLNRGSNLSRIQTPFLAAILLSFAKTPQKVLLLFPTIGRLRGAWLKITSERYDAFNNAVNIHSQDPHVSSRDFESQRSR